MAEAERRALPKMRLHLGVQVAENFVGGEHHHDVGRFDGRFEEIDLKPCRLGLGRACRAAAKPDHDVDSAVLEVKRLCPALVAVAENGDSLACERPGIDVGVSE